MFSTTFALLLVLLFDMLVEPQIGDIAKMLENTMILFGFARNDRENTMIFDTFAMPGTHLLGAARNSMGSQIRRLDPESALILLGPQILLAFRCGGVTNPGREAGRPRGQSALIIDLGRPNCIVFQFPERAVLFSFAFGFGAVRFITAPQRSKNGFKIGRHALFSDFLRSGCRRNGFEDGKTRIATEATSNTPVEQHARPPA